MLKMLTLNRYQNHKYQASALDLNYNLEKSWTKFIFLRIFPSPYVLPIDAVLCFSTFYSHINGNRALQTTLPYNTCSSDGTSCM